MGVYVNPGNVNFKRIDGENYIDKTGLIDLINKRIGKENSLVCVSRPRRFGKTYAAKMLTAYYDCSCDSRDLFEGKVIEKTKNYETYLNKYNVIYLDISSFVSDIKEVNGSLRDVPGNIKAAIWNDLLEIGFEPKETDSLNRFLLRCTEGTNGKPFIFIIDEWDAVIRESKDDDVAQEAYLNLLRGWFKNENFTSKAVAAVYMTGILPIKKDGSQSAISDFDEFSVVKPRKFAPYVGFTEEEVRNLCESHDVDFATMKFWYDGYSFKGVGSVYNPNSVMKAIENDDFDSYWSESSTSKPLMEYISKDYNGLTKTIAELIGGIDVKVNTNGFANDLTTFNSKDDVLTLLIHLGYLAYNSETRTARIPNEEIRQEFQKTIHEVKHEATIKRLEESEKLFADTIQGNEEAVAAQIEKVHAEETSPIHYNKEDSLRSVIKLAYYTYKDHYLQLDELGSGEGFADVVYVPINGSDLPILVIELKWNESADSAINQIINKKYTYKLEDYGCPILLVGITYNKEAGAGKKKHSCKIVEYKK